MKLITIKESHFATDLTVLKSRLESEDIECYVEGELTSQVLNHIPSIQAKLKILECDFERVKQILIETGELEIENIVIVCPKCGSERFHAKNSPKELWRIIGAVLLTLITFVPVNNSYRSKKYVCKRCENEFSS